MMIYKLLNLNTLYVSLILNSLFTLEYFVLVAVFHVIKEDIIYLMVVAIFHIIASFCNNYGI